MNSPRPPDNANHSSPEVKYSSTLAQAVGNVVGAHLSRTGRRLSPPHFEKLLLTLLEQAEREDVRGRS